MRSTLLGFSSSVQRRLELSLAIRGVEQDTVWRLIQVEALDLGCYRGKAIWDTFDISHVAAKSG